MPKLLDELNAVAFGAKEKPMPVDLEKILESKRALRRHLAARPIGEKLRMLDALREREIAIRGHAVPPPPLAGILREPPAAYRAKPQ